MNIVFIVGSYYPNYSAVGKCAGNIADELSKKHHVTIICIKSSLDQKDTEQYNNQNILRVVTKQKVRREKATENIKRAHGVKKVFYIFLLNAIKIHQILKLIFSKTSINKELVDSYLFKLLDIDTSIDVIIPASMPFESIVSAYKYKTEYNESTVLIPYLFDKFTDSATLHRLVLNRVIKKKLHIKLEIEVLSASKIIIAMRSLEKFYKINCSCLKQIIFVEHPLLVRNDSTSQHLLDLSTINVAYIGGFYKKYVEPNYLLRLFYKSKINAALHFYVVGNCNAVINRYYKLAPKKIFNHGSIDKSITSLKLLENNILVNVAEKNGLQLSSKIFDYMSCGKPIVHFYRNNNDVNLDVLKKYPLALCIKEKKDIFDQNVKAFENFCQMNSSKIVPWNIVFQLYPDALPEYTASLIERNLEE